MSIWEATEQ